MADHNAAESFRRGNDVAGIPPEPKLKKKCEGCGREYETANPRQRFCWSGCKGARQWTARRSEQFQRATNRKGLPVTWGTGKPRA